MAAVKIDGRAYDLKVTWAAHEKLKSRLGEDYTRILHEAFDKRDLTSLSIGVACCVDDLDADTVYLASPAISPIWEALTEALLISFYGPSKTPEGGDKSGKLIGRLISYATRQGRRSDAA